jgi:membrane protein implicated in regulation of membrane protease activity
MILSVAAFLTAFGFAAFVVGSVFDMPEVALIGGVLIVGVGAMFTAYGLEYRSGSVESNVSTNETSTQYQYDTVKTPTRLPLGALVMILGATVAVRQFNRFEEP